MTDENTKEVLDLVKEFSTKLVALDKRTGIKTKLVIAAGEDAEKPTLIAFRVNGRNVEPVSHQVLGIIETFSVVQNLLGV